MYTTIHLFLSFTNYLFTMLIQKHFSQMEYYILRRFNGILKFSLGLTPLSQNITSFSTLASLKNIGPDLAPPLPHTLFHGPRITTELESPLPLVAK